MPSNRGHTCQSVAAVPPRDPAKQVDLGPIGRGAGGMVAAGARRVARQLGMVPVHSGGRGGTGGRMLFMISNQAQDNDVIT